jgi:hypothetical protein
MDILAKLLICFIAVMGTIRIVATIAAILN